MLEEKLNAESCIVGFFSFGTALAKYATKRNEEKTIVGISLWVIFDWPDVGIESFESHLTKLANEVGLDTIECKAVKGRGMTIFI